MILSLNPIPPANFYKSHDWAKNQRSREHNISIPAPVITHQRTNKG
jgi:hypothetical protein